MVFSGELRAPFFSSSINKSFKGIYVVESEKEQWLLLGPELLFIGYCANCPLDMEEEGDKL